MKTNRNFVQLRKCASKRHEKTNAMMVNPSLITRAQSRFALIGVCGEVALIITLELKLIGMTFLLRLRAIDVGQSGKLDHTQPHNRLLWIRGLRMKPKSKRTFSTLVKDCR
jgi:hypothetical protein